MKTKRDAIIVFTGELARKLLKDGYTIIDVKPHKHLQNASVFVFKNKDGLEDKIRQYTR